MTYKYKKTTRAFITIESHYQISLIKPLPGGLFRFNQNHLFR